MTKAFLAAMIVLAISAVGVTYYKISTDSISVEEEAGKISPASLNRSISDSEADKENNANEEQASLTNDETTTKSETCLAMSYTEAKAIALAGVCGAETKLKEAHFCNEETKTWWIDLDSINEGCNPACVINIETKAAEINWRCTGAIMPTGSEVETNAVPLTGVTPTAN